MSFIEMDGLNDVTEAKPLLENYSLDGLVGTKKVTLSKDYTLVIEDVTAKEKDGRMSGLLVKHSIDGCGDDVAPVFHNITIPAPDADPEKRKNTLLFNKRYLVLFGIDFANGIDPASMIGKRAKCKLTLEEYEGSWSNKIITPMIK